MRVHPLNIKAASGLSKAVSGYTMVEWEKTGGKSIVLNTLKSFLGCWCPKLAELTSQVHRRHVMT